MFDLSKIFDLSKTFTVPDTMLKLKNYCIDLHFFTPSNAESSLELHVVWL